MRLIDADAFKESIGIETKLRRIICSAIDTQPTVYDVEKVVAELEALEDTNTREVYLTKHICLDETVEIVRRGGVG